MPGIEQHYPRLRTANSGVDWQNESPVLLNLVESIMEQAGKIATITSGYRSPEHNREVGGAEHSKHTRGLALDATVGGVPIARAIPASIWNRYGIRSGDQPGFFRGGRDPVHVDIPDDTEWGRTLVQDIIRNADQEDVDPEAALAVFSYEGGFLGKVGDQGTSFGPAQLHIGGAMPRGKGGSWANTPAGVDYTLQRIGDVAGGLRGEQAIQAIVARFERPADVGTEVENASARYRQIHASGNGRDPNKWIDVAGPAGLPLPGIPSGPGIPGIPNPFDGDNPLSGLSAIGNFFRIITWPFQSYAHLKRFGQIIAGGILILMGLYLLARRSGMAPEVPEVVKAAALSVK